jgi:ComF family protein
MKELLARYKYRSDERLQQLMGRMLVHAYRLYPKTGGAGSPFDYISYVPVSSERYEERGFNQAEQMALVVAGQVNLPVVSLLARTRHTDKQSFKSRKERADNLQGAFAVIPGRAAKLQAHAKRRDLRILLVDDVYTTGSTLNQCALELRRELPAAQVYGLCWAR